MSVCDPITGMHHVFKNVLPEHYFADAPGCAFHEPWEEKHLDSIRQLVETHHGSCAAVILEPIVQGAGGMRFYSPEYLKRLKALCTRYDLLLIIDEIATGFGRTGEMFACHHAGIEPDILCLGKALTGGYLPLAATLTTDRISRVICEGECKGFMHGPTQCGGSQYPPSFVPGLEEKNPRNRIRAAQWFIPMQDIQQGQRCPSAWRHWRGGNETSSRLKKKFRKPLSGRVSGLDLLWQAGLYNAPLYY